MVEDRRPSVIDERAAHAARFGALLMDIGFACQKDWLGLKQPEERAE